MSLKWSASISPRASGSLMRARRSSSLRAISSTARRFGTPVSASVRAIFSRSWFFCSSCGGPLRSPVLQVERPPRSSSSSFSWTGVRAQEHVRATPRIVVSRSSSRHGLSTRRWIWQRLTASTASLDAGRAGQQHPGDPRADLPGPLQEREAAAVRQVQVGDDDVDGVGGQLAAGLGGRAGGEDFELAARVGGRAAPGSSARRRRRAPTGGTASRAPAWRSSSRHGGSSGRLRGFGLVNRTFLSSCGRVHRSAVRPQLQPSQRSNVGHPAGRNIILIPAQRRRKWEEP